jgi:hypothetical protein
VPSALHFSIGPADDHVRHVVVHVLVRVTHVAAEQHQRAIEERSVALLLLREIFDQVRQHLHVVLIDLRQLADLPRILAVMRHAVETSGRRRALRIRAAGEVACEEQCADARDVGLESEREQVETGS